jgi:hypothetical protein
MPTLAPTVDEASLQCPKLHRLNFGAEGDSSLEP